MKIRLILDRITGKAIMAGDKAVAVRSTSDLNIQQTSTLSQADYDALATKDTATLYLITGESGYVKAYIGDSPLYREPEPRTISGTSAIVFTSIDGGRIKSLVRYGKVTQGSVPCVTSITQLGKCEQNGTPTPSAPVDIVCNNGAIKVRRPSGMPIAYQMVEWLKPTGSIPITGFKTKSTQEITTVFYRERSGASYLYSSDTNTSGTTNTTAYLTSGAGNWRWDGKSYSIAVSSGIQFTSIQNKNGVWLNGTKYGSYTDPGDFVSANDLRLSSNENTTVRIYSMTIREGDTVTLDLVPVQRLSDNAYGFYDKVSGNFYTNAEATFTAGDPIADPVEIYTDGTPEALTVSGKNLFDPTKVLFGYYRDSSTGNKRTSSANFMSSDDGYIPCLPNTAYTFVGTNKTDGTYSKYNTIYFFDSAKNYLGASSYQISQPTTGTTPSNCRYLQVRSNPLDTVSVSIQDVFQRFNWQLELGSTATDYEPYNAQTVTVPMLLGVGDYKDTAEIISGLLTHRIGLYVIKGSDDEGWAENTSYSGTFYADCLPVAVSHPALSMFTRYKGVDSSTSVAAMSNGTAKCGSSSNRQRIFIRDASCADVDAFKAKLSGFYADGTPCIVAFVLATETTESTTAHPELTNQKYTSAYAEGSVDDITVTVTRGVTSTPTPYTPIPIICNNGKVTSSGATGTPEVLTLSAAGETDQTASVADLLQVGDVKDEQEIITGVKTDKVGVMVFDGSEAWRASSSANIYILDSAIAVGLTAICTHFVKVSNITSAVNMPDGSFKGHASNAILYFKCVSAGNVDGFKALLAAQYAAGTPVIMLYPLATPTTEQVTPQPLICHMGTNEVESVCNVSDPEIKIIYPE